MSSHHLLALLSHSGLHFVFSPIALLGLPLPIYHKNFLQLQEVDAEALVIGQVAALRLMFQVLASPPSW